MNRKIIITAGASGIGLEIARHFAERGASVAICDIDELALERVSAEFDLAALCDVTDADQVCEFVEKAVEELDGLTTVVANAGTAGPTALLEDISPDEWAQTLAVNLTGQFNLLRASIPYLKAQGQGAIILMSSVAGRLGLPMRGPYSAAKWGVIGLKETLAMELGPHGITVNAILPGSVKGPRMDAVISAKAEACGISIEEARNSEVQNTSLRRMIDASEIAELVWYVASPAARSLSGQSLGLCGNFETLR